MRREHRRSVFGNLCKKADGDNASFGWPPARSGRLRSLSLRTSGRPNDPAPPPPAAPALLPTAAMNRLSNLRAQLAGSSESGRPAARCAANPPGPCLSSAPTAAVGGATEILWDTYGIPHIFAPDHASLFRAYGWSQMEAHSELLLSLYVQAQGRGAEFYSPAMSASGSSPEQRIPNTVLQADRWVRTNDIPATARTWAAGQSDEFGPLIEAFAAGINEWAAEHPEQLSAESSAVLAALGGIAPEHVYAHCLRVIHYDWVISPARLAARLRAVDQNVHGSNEWAIGPSRSASGNTMLLSNSHLQWGDRHTYFEVHLNAPGVNSSGAVWVGFPVLRQCFNSVLGWTQVRRNPLLFSPPHFQLTNAPRGVRPQTTPACRIYTASSLSAMVTCWTARRGSSIRGRRRLR